MDFDAAVPWWWTPTAIAAGIAFMVLIWAQADRQYSDAPFKRTFFRGFGIFFGIAMPVVVHMANTEAIRVRGNAVEVRKDFAFAGTHYEASDIVSYDIRRVRSGGGTGARGGATSQMKLFVRFRDGFEVSIPEKYGNYDRLQSWLDGRGVQRRQLP